MKMDETGITNLGPVPEGVSYLAAIKATRKQRKFKINPGHQSGRLTICETLREIYRRAEDLPEKQRQAFQELASAGFDMGKRMDARMKELKGMIP